MNRTVILLLSLVMLCSVSAKAQYLDNNPTRLQRIFYGGNMGMTFGDITLINISPEIGYRITNRLSAGIGGTYIYYRDNLYDIKMNLWGTQQFASFTIIKNFANILPFGENGGGLLLYGELNSLYLSELLYNPASDDRYWVISPLLGPAYQLQVGNRSYLLVMLLYNFNESSRSPLQNPVFRVSLQF